MHDRCKADLKEGEIGGICSSHLLNQQHQEIPFLLSPLFSALASLLQTVLLGLLVELKMIRQVNKFTVFP